MFISENIHSFYYTIFLIFIRKALLTTNYETLYEKIVYLKIKIKASKNENYFI